MNTLCRISCRVDDALESHVAKRYRSMSMPLDSAWLWESSATLISRRKSTLYLRAHSKRVKSSSKLEEKTGIDGPITDGDDYFTPEAPNISEEIGIMSGEDLDLESVLDSIEYDRQMSTTNHDIELGNDAEDDVRTLTELY